LKEICLIYFHDIFNIIIGWRRLIKIDNENFQSSFSSKSLCERNNFIFKNLELLKNEMTLFAQIQLKRLKRDFKKLETVALIYFLKIVLTFYQKI